MPEQQDEEQTAETLGHTMKAAWQTAQQFLADVAALAALETRMAGQAMVAMLAIAIAIAFCVMAAWLLLWGALAFWLGLSELTWPWALLVLAIINLVAIVGLLGLLRRLSRRLTFRATRRALQEVPSNDEP